MLKLCCVMLDVGSPITLKPFVKSRVVVNALVVEFGDQMKSLFASLSTPVTPGNAGKPISLPPFAP